MNASEDFVDRRLHRRDHRAEAIKIKTFVTKYIYILNIKNNYCLQMKFAMDNDDENT